MCAVDPRGVEAVHKGGGGGGAGVVCITSCYAFGLHVATKRRASR